MRLRAAVLVGLVAMLVWVSTPAFAQTVPDDLPPDLQPWVAWVLHDTPDVVCPDVAGDRVCRWPGALEIVASADGATFAMSVFADRETSFSLPGSTEHWPQDVRVGFRPGLIVTEGERPAVRVPAGAHRITGAFEWSELPELLSIPTDVGQVSLTLGGDSVSRPRVDSEGRVWFRDRSTESTQMTAEESVRASIYRRFSDGVPLVVTTRVRLNISGRAREVELGKILVPQSRPTAVRAQIPVQVGRDGATKVYVRPGTHDVEIDAVVAQPTAELVAPAITKDFYDPQEVWIWVPNESVRSVELGGLNAVDPERTSLPDDWAGYTTFLAEPEQKLTLEVTRRGVEESQPNTLSLERDLWLDLDGRGYTIRDRVWGTLNEGWRLDYSALAGAELGRVSQGGENLLITERPDSGLPGVELRSANVEVEAEVRVENARATLPIVGWDHDVQFLDARLHLPPGWTLLGGKGVDTMEGTWIESWTLWDFFFVLMISLVIGKLFGWPWAAVSILALSLAHGHEDAPEWIWIHLIAALALLRVLPNGWWRKGIVVYRTVALIALVLVLAPFAHDQILVALHPQVSAARSFSSGFVQMKGEHRFVDQAQQAPAMAPPTRHEEGGFEMAEESAMEQDELALSDRMERKVRKKGSGELWNSGSDYKGQAQLQQVDPNAVVQTGPGLPTWEWSTWTLDWTGPVRHDHTITLWLLSPAANRALGFIRVALLILLALLLLAPRDMYWKRRKPAPGWWRRLFGVGGALLATGLVFGAGEPVAYAQQHFEVQNNVSSQGRMANLLPGHQSDVLQALKQRIVDASRCDHPCVVASGADFTVTGLDLRMIAEVSADKDTAWTLPGPADVLQIDQVFVDGRPTKQLRRESEMMQVRLPQGTHRIEMTGTLADRNVVTIQFDDATRPRHVTFDAESWSVDGLSPTGVPDNSVQLTRSVAREPDAGDAASGAADLPPWYSVNRVVALGMPWQIHTAVSREDPRRPQLVKIPLVSGEKVITEGVRVENGFALLDFPRGESTITFVGEIPIGEQVKLGASKDEPWTETWSVDCSRIWRCSFSELPPVSVVADGSWRPTWKPWPGEELTIDVTKPQGAAGQPKTVQSVDYTVTPGKRLMQAEIQLTVQASQGDWQEVKLPTEAELQSVSVNGTNRIIRPRDGTVRLPIQPGETTFVLRWQQPWERDTVERVPAVDLGSDAANVRIKINRGGDRWLLALRGDGMNWGPAILFWPHLIILLILALLLGTIRDVPVRTHEWLLLVIGMSQVPVVALLPVVGWFVALAWRRRYPAEQWWKFDAAQIALLILTIMAIGALYASVHTNLLVDVDMQVDGMNSTNHMLQWYADRVQGELPTPAILSVPLLVWRGVMFLWALWLVSRLLTWAQWGWRSFSVSGRWRTPKNRSPRKQRSSVDGSPDSPGHPRGGSDGPEEGRPDEPEERLAEVEVTPELDPEWVGRNARDGELIHVEIELTSAELKRRRESDEALEDTVDLTPEEETSPGDDAPQVPDGEEGVSADISEPYDTGESDADAREAEQAADEEPREKQGVEDQEE